jgi:hypothetical protein
MRARRNLTGNYRTYKRTFYTESEFLRFAGSRGPDDLIDLVHTIPSGLADTLSINFEMVKQPEPWGNTKAASASQR